MKRRIPKRRILKWVGLTLSFAFVPFWITTLYHGFGYQGTSTRVLVKCGYVNVYNGTNRLPTTWWYHRLEPGAFRKMYWPVYLTAGTEYSLTIPLLYPFLMIVIATFWLCRADRRPKTGCKHCGYDLTGNVSGVCPECGAVIESSVLESVE